MPDFVQLEKQFLAHDLQRANFPSIFLGCKINLTIASLPDLSKDLKIAMSQPSPSLPQIGSLSAKVLVPGRLVLLLWGLRWRWHRAAENLFTVLTVVDVAQEIKVII